MTPTRGSTLAAGYDVYSTITCTVEPQQITEIPLNISIAPPHGTYIQVLPRSGLARIGITIFAGVIDPDYRGNIIVLLYNVSTKPLPIQCGDRIAQIIFKHHSMPNIEVVTTLEQTE